MNKKLALGMLTASLALPLQAQSQQSVDDIRRTLEDLVQRVNRLETENRELKQENSTLKEQQDKLDATTEYLKSNTAASRKQAAQDAVKIEKADALVKAAEWAGKVAVKGDMRYRHEQISDDTTATAGGPVSAVDRYRDRVRARVNIEGKPADNILVGVGLATTEQNTAGTIVGGDSRSSNVSLDGDFSRKSLDLDLAYVDWKFKPWGNVVAGKMKQTFVKPGQSLFWDGDVNPEGIAININNGVWFGTGYYYWMDEVSGAATARTADMGLAGLQIGARIPMGTGNLAVGAHYYDLMSGQGRATGSFWNNSTNGNTTVGGSLAYDFEVIELFAEFNTLVGALPLQIWADVAKNQADDDLGGVTDDLDTAIAGGFLFGKASNAKTWELGLFYQKIEKDALFAQLIDSDFGGGVTDSKGYVLKFGYAPVKNWTLNGTYFKNKRNVDVVNGAGQLDVGYDRLQLDANFKF